MPLDPQVDAYLTRQAALPPRSAMTVAQTREFLRDMSRLAGEPIPLPRVEDRKIPGHESGHEISVRIYAPRQDRLLPVLVYLHGGRFISGDLETHDIVCRTLAKEADYLVVAVDYRLAPEHKVPAAVHDAFAAAKWVAEHATEIGGDPACIGVGGDSAGGNLAAATALMARNLQGPGIAFQMLIYPMLDATCSRPSHTEYASGYGPGSADMKRGYEAYLSEALDRRHPYISPLWTPDTRGLPPAFILTVEYDSLRDEGEEYARRLAEGGVPVVSVRLDGAIHGVFTLAGVLDVGKRAIREAAQFLRSRIAT